MSRSRHRDAPYWVHSDPEAPVEPVAVQAPESLPERFARLQREADAACPGQCNHRWRKAQARILADLERAAAGAFGDPGILSIFPQAGDLTFAARAPIWCRACADEILTGLGRLPDLAAACGWRRDGQLMPPPPSEGHAVAVAPPSQSPGFDQAEAIASFVAEWSDRLSRHLALPDPATYRQDGTRGYTLSTHVAWLAGHKTALLSAPFAQEFGKALLSLVYRSEMVGGVDALVHKIREPCFVCHRSTLRRRDGSDRVVCEGCGRDWPSHLFDYLAHNIVKEA